MASNRIDINTARLEDFEQLLGVGSFKAEAIVKHRKAVGGFKLVGELSVVPGVGQSVLDLNRSHLFCGPIKRQTRLSRGCVEKGGKSAGRRAEPVVVTSRSGLSSRLRHSSENLPSKPLKATRRQRQVSGTGKQDPRKLKDVTKPVVKDKDVSVSQEAVLASTSTVDNTSVVKSSVSNCVKCVTVTVQGEAEEEEDEREKEEERGEEEEDRESSSGGEASEEERDAEPLPGERMEECCGVVECGGGDSLSAEMSMSESLCGSTLARSRIPVPIMGSCYSKHMMKRKSSLHSEDLLLPSGKRMCRTEFPRMSLAREGSERIQPNQPDLYRVAKTLLKRSFKTAWREGVNKQQFSTQRQGTFVSTVALMGLVDLAGEDYTSSSRKVCTWRSYEGKFGVQRSASPNTPKYGFILNSYERHFITASGKSPQTTYGNLKAPLRRTVHLQRQRIPSKENPPTGLAEWLKQFQDWGNAERLMAVDHLITLCEPTQVRHMMQVIEPQFQRDFISLLPKELALYVLSFLEPKDLLQAAQTCRYWRVLAEDNLLWREKCREETIDESLVFGSNRLRRRQPSPKSPWKGLYMRQHQIEQNWRTGALRSPKLLKGHDDHVITCLEFCGNRVVSGSDDNTLKVWSAVTGKCLRTLVGHTGGVWSSQMQGITIISGSTDRTLKVWNADTGQCMYTLYGHTSTVRCMHLHESKVVSGSRDATLRVWNIETGTCLHVLMGHVAAVRCVQYDGKRVVSGAYDYLVKVWDPETETCLHTLQGHTNRVYSLQFDSVHIVSGSLDTSIRVWDVESGNCLHTLIGHQSLTSGLELKDNILVSGNADSTVKVWDITTGQCLQTLQGSNKHQSAVTCLQFNKKFVITSSDDGTVKIWDLKSGDFLRNLVTLESGGSGGVVWRVRCNNTKLVCAVGSRNGTEETKLLVLDFDVEERKEKLPLIERL